MFRKFVMLITLISAPIANVFAAESSDFMQTSFFSADMDQHGTFVAEDLLTSPLLRSMFNLSVNDVNHDYVRVCLEGQSKCRVVRRDSKVYLVASNGKVHFDDSVTK